MTVKEFSNLIDCQIVCMPEEDKEITGCYAGDLLSWVMGKAQSGDVWVTIMSNLNVVAVASLTDVACVLLSENVELDNESVLKKAYSEGINILKTDLDTFGACVKIAKLL